MNEKKIFLTEITVAIIIIYLAIFSWVMWNRTANLSQDVHKLYNQTVTSERIELTNGNYTTRTNLINSIFKGQIELYEEYKILRASTTELYSKVFPEIFSQ